MKSLLAAMMVLGFYWATAQLPSYRIFTMRDGLSQMKITALHLDSKGYLWIGTRNGLNKFDGEKFSVFTESDGLPHNRIHNIEEDRDGNLVILTYNGISIFNGEIFTNYIKPFNSVLFDLAVDRENTIWICEKYTNPSLYTFRNGKYKTIVEKKGSLHFQYDQIHDVKSVVSQGNLYTIEGDSLELIDSSYYFFYPNSGDVTGRASFMKESHKNKGIRSIFYYNKIKRNLVASSIDVNNKLFTKDHNKNGIWNSIRGQLDLPDNGSGRLVFKNEFPITNNVVKDDNNQFWIGSENGLGQIYNDAFTSVPTKELSNIWSIIEDKNHNIWFASYGNGMFLQPSRNAKIRPVTKAKAIHYLAGSAIDNKGRLYFATNLGLEIIDGDKSGFVWNNKSVFSVFYDKKNDRIIFGTIEGVGIFQKQQRILYYGPKQGMHENHYIQTIGMDKNDHYWLGSYSGLSRLLPTTGTIVNYTNKNGKLPCQGVYCSFLDNQDNYWLGGDNGLMYYDDCSDSIILIKSVLVNTMVKSIIDLDNDKLLISTKDGLYVFHRKEFTHSGNIRFDILNVTNGYMGIDPGFMGMYKDSKGYIWITSSTSVDRLNPEKLLLSNQSLRTKITHLNNRRLPFVHKDVIKLPYGEANVIIKFEGIGFTRPTKTKFKYRLNHGEWTIWSEEKEAILENLETGMYTFDVMAGPLDVTTNERGIDSMKFYIQLPFYKSKWFAPIAITIITILMLLAAFFFFRQRFAQKKFKTQMAEAKFLRSQLLLAQLNPHFIFNVLSNIQNKILFDKKEEASKGIINLSKLLRNFLNASYKGSNLPKSGFENEISLYTEIEMLQSYIEFEQDKNDHHFDFCIEHPPQFLPENYSIPPLLLQPFVENAIKHGLLLQEKRGNLWIRFNDDRGDLVCVIEDDGVGIEKAIELQKESFVVHSSLGSKIVKERVQLLNELGYNIEINTFTRLPQGTIVQIKVKE
jgi:ligand-binding sensor domain-containing protein